MERIYVLTFIYTVIPIVTIGIILGLLIMLLARRNQRKTKEKTEKKLNIQKVFSSLSVGSSLLLVKDRLGACKSISSANLVSEVILENGVNRKVYVWYLDWVDDTYSNNGIAVAGMPKGQKAFIKMVFDNDKLVAKEQQGLYQ